jgi:hypothetical protein
MIFDLSLGLDPWVVEYWGTGVLEYWSIGVLEYWSAEVLECFRPNRRQPIRNPRNAGAKRVLTR